MKPQAGRPEFFAQRCFRSLRNSPSFCVGCGSNGTNLKPFASRATKNVRLYPCTPSFRLRAERADEIHPTLSVDGAVGPHELDRIDLSSSTEQEADVRRATFTLTTRISKQVVTTNRIATEVRRQCKPVDYAPFRARIHSGPSANARTPTAPRRARRPL